MPPADRRLPSRLPSCLRETQVRQVVAGADQLQQVVVARWLVAP